MNECKLNIISDSEIPCGTEFYSTSIKHVVFNDGDQNMMVSVSVRCAVHDKHYGEFIEKLEGTVYGSKSDNVSELKSKAEAQQRMLLELLMAKYGRPEEVEVHEESKVA